MSDKLTATPAYATKSQCSCGGRLVFYNADCCRWECAGCGEPRSSAPCLEPWCVGDTEKGSQP